jgi:uncharacterized protein (DUF2252 family)
MMTAAESAPKLTVQERIDRGREARARVPRSSHAAFSASPRRPDPVALLEKQSAARVPELVPIRYGRMLASPFTFFRGAALVMAADLASTPDAGIRAQICGDAHLANFGAYASPERRLVFDVNDFDETLPGPWEWDIKRLVASLAVAGRVNNHSAAVRQSITTAAVAQYRTAMNGFAAMPTIDVWYSHIDVDDLLAQVKRQLQPAEYKTLIRDLTQARNRDNEHTFSKLTQVVDGVARIVSDPPLVVPLSELYAKLEADRVLRTLAEVNRGYLATLSNDRRHLLAGYHLIEGARKVVGIGSVGTRTWVMLLAGKDADDHLVLQAKETERSVLEQFVGPSEFQHHGERVVSGQRLMQATSDIFLGWNRIREPDGKERDYYVRQLRDWKWSPDFTVLSAAALKVWGRLCGWALARGHARSGDGIAIAAYLGQSDSFDRSMVSFAEAYADQNERDYAGFQKAVKDKRIAAMVGI